MKVLPTFNLSLHPFWATISFPFSTMNLSARARTLEAPCRSDRTSMSGNKKMVNGWNPEESLLQQLTEHIVRVNVGAQTFLAHLFQFLNNVKICIDIVVCEAELYILMLLVS